MEIKTDLEQTLGSTFSHRG